MSRRPPLVTRRRFLQWTTAAGLASLTRLSPAYAQPDLAETAPDSGTGPGRQQIELTIDHTQFRIGEQTGTAVTMNGTIPGPLLRLREGDTVAIRVANRLDVDASIHWHGLLVPPDMDGVPGVSFPGIPAGGTFTYEFPLKQYGTYWYHSHSATHEQLGQYGPFIIVPRDPDPFVYDREYVVMFSDWTFVDSARVLNLLKKQNDYFNYHRRTVGDLFHDVRAYGIGATLSDRLAWNRMRMSPTDIADVTGSTYTYLLNGLPADANWTALFRSGDRVRLRCINGSAMTYFNVRIPGLPMTVVQADGQNVQPVTVDEFQIAVAETYDVIVQPSTDRAYTIFAEAMDRSGYTRGTLAPREGMQAPVPELRPPPLRSMMDMGMDMEHGGGMEMPKTAPVAGHAGHQMRMGNAASGPDQIPSEMKNAGPVVARHGPDHHGAGNTTIATVQRNRLGEPGTGLEDVGHRVLVYNDLRSVKPGSDHRPPDRELELHLTGNMQQFMWSFDGKKFSEVGGPIPFNYGERLRLTLVNDTMMEHPMHLHGMFMELDNGSGSVKPLKHTINVKPAERVSLEITADAPGNWAFHCHLLYHMEAGMFRVVNVSGPTSRDG